MSEWEGHRFECLRCDHDSALFTTEWPPKLVVCTSCQLAMKLVAYDPETEVCSFRRTTTQP